jgi:hypothetical protein
VQNILYLLKEQLAALDTVWACTSSYTYTTDSLGRATGISQTVTDLSAATLSQTFNGDLEPSSGDTICHS